MAVWLIDLIARSSRPIRVQRAARITRKPPPVETYEAQSTEVSSSKFRSSDVLNRLFEAKSGSGVAPAGLSFDSPCNLHEKALEKVSIRNARLLPLPC